MSPRQIIAQRNRRALFFPHMDETQWLVLVDLLANDGREISVTSACIASFSPPTTALRAIGELHDADLVSRHPDPDDRRRVFLRLTDDARARLGQFFSPSLALSPLNATGGAMQTTPRSKPMRAP